MCADLLFKSIPLSPCSCVGAAFCNAEGRINLVESIKSDHNEGMKCKNFFRVFALFAREIFTINQKTRQNFLTYFLASPASMRNVLKSPSTRREKSEKKKNKLDFLHFPQRKNIL